MVPLAEPHSELARQLVLKTFIATRLFHGDSGRNGDWWLPGRFNDEFINASFAIVCLKFRDHLMLRLCIVDFDWIGDGGPDLSSSNGPGLFAAPTPSD